MKSNPCDLTSYTFAREIQPDFSFGEAMIVSDSQESTKKSVIAS